MGWRGSGLIRNVFAGAALVIFAGCVQRTLTVTSTPPGALVYLNGQEVGRTPMTRDFTWYGTYDVQLRREGYETLDTKAPVHAPFWQWVPLDLLAELWPGHLKDHRKLDYVLTPASTQPADPATLLASAEEMRGRLESSPFTKPPTTRAATTRAAAAATTQPTTSPKSSQ